MFGYGNEEPVPPTRSLLTEVDDLIDHTSTTLTLQQLQQSPAGKLSSSKKSSEESTGLRFSNIRLVGVVFLCDFLLLTMVVPILPLVFKGTAYASPINLALAFASKPVSQIIVNPAAGYVVDQYGPRKPMLIGSLVATLSCGVLIVALMDVSSTSTSTSNTMNATNRYMLCVVARIVQGMASAFTNSSGFTLIVQTHHEGVRGSAVGIASIGIALGVLLGPPIAGLLGSIEPWLPFVSLLGFLAINMIMQLFAYSKVGGKLGERSPMYRSSRLRGSLDAALLDDDETYRYAVRGSNLGLGMDATADIKGGTCTGCRLLKDPMISIVAMSAVIANATVGMIEPLIPLSVIFFFLNLSTFILKLNYFSMHFI
jgi:MFS family permease